MSSQLMDEIWLLAEEAWKAYEGEGLVADFKYLTQSEKDRWFKVGTKMYEYRHGANL